MGNAIAYFFSSFPQISTTFLQREVRAIRSLGINPTLVANRPPGKGEYHPTDRDLLNQTFYLSSVSPLLYFRAHFKRFFISPGCYLKGVINIFLLMDKKNPRIFFKNIIRFAGAVVLAEYLENKKIFHVHVHFAFGAAGVAIFLKLLSKVTYSISIHGSDVLLPQPLTEEKLKQAEFVISNCRFHIQNLIDRYPTLASQRFYPIYLGVDISSDSWATATAPSPLEGKLRILNVAMLRPVKGHEILLQACAELQKKGVSFECRIIGEGSEREKLEAMIEQLNLSRSVRLLGACYEPEVLRQLKWAHLVVLSSYSEGTPMAIIEAMMKGRAVVAPRITAIPEMVIEGESGLLFDKADPDDLARKLANIAEQPKLIYKMGNEGRKRAATLFDLRMNARKIVGLFDQQ